MQRGLLVTIVAALTTGAAVLAGAAAASQLIDRNAKNVSLAVNAEG